MAKRGRKAGWVPPITRERLAGKGVMEACEEAGINPNTIRKLYTEERGQISNVLKWLAVLGFSDDEPVMKVLNELGGQNSIHSDSIVPGSTPKLSKTHDSSDGTAKHGMVQKINLAA